MAKYPRRRASAARLYDRRVVGVVLSGIGNDGAAGLRLIHDHGGLALAQELTEAPVPQMPAAAFANDNRQFLPIMEMLVGWLSSGPPGSRGSCLRGSGSARLGAQAALLLLTRQCRLLGESRSNHTARQPATKVARAVVAG